MRSSLGIAESEVLDWWVTMDPENKASREPVKVIQEMEEFLLKPSFAEGADVAIALMIWFFKNHLSLGAYCLRKLRINRDERTWEQLPSGHFQHVK